jgi:hypothetical protein
VTKAAQQGFEYQTITVAVIGNENPEWPVFWEWIIHIGPP